MRVEDDSQAMKRRSAAVTTDIPSDLFTAEQSREADYAAIHEQGVPSIKLMKRAASAAFDVLRAQWPDERRITVFCGKGNNGGDGYIVAGLAQAAGLLAEVYQMAPLGELKGDAKKAADFALSHGVVPKPFEASASLEESGVIVDAMLGTGLSAPLRKNYAQAIEQINVSGKPVLAIDIPSGLGSDDGHVYGADAVRADHTVTFITVKQGLLTGRAGNFVGQLHFVGLGVSVKPEAQTLRLQLQTLLQAVPPRSADANKGRFGHVLIVGGNYGFAGAALMAASSALRCGAGLVSVATRPEHCATLLGARPEVMARAVSQRSDVLPLLEMASVVVVGPGLGQDVWGQQLLAAVLESRKPAVIDADAINLIAQGAGTFEQSSRYVFTPHPGEAARVLACSAADVQRDRFAALDALQDKLGGTVLLKGAGTLIRGKTLPRLLCPYGNPGMASGGMGDVLSGVIAALMAQGLSATDAAALAACLHAAAADRLAEKQGMIGMLATDLLPEMRAYMNTRGPVDV